MSRAACGFCSIQLLAQCFYYLLRLYALNHMLIHRVGADQSFFLILIPIYPASPWRSVVNIKLSIAIFFCDSRYLLRVIFLHLNLFVLKFFYFIRMFFLKFSYFSFVVIPDFLFSVVGLKAMNDERHDNGRKVPIVVRYVVSSIISWLCRCYYYCALSAKPTCACLRQHCFLCRLLSFVEL